LIAKYEREHRRNSDAAVPAWILPELSCQFLQDVAATLPAGSAAFEFGSGRSTHVLRRTLPATTSVEHSSDWLGQTEHLNEAVAKRAADKTVVLPLSRCWHRFRPIESFDLVRDCDAVERLAQAHLILVDSPPNPAKREHALFLALHYAQPGAVIILDDLEVRATARFAERFARQNSRIFRFWILNIDHRLAVFLKIRHGRLQSRPSLIEFVGTWLRA
jgi:hypothetical protein